MCKFTYHTPRKLDGVVAKLEPFSEQHALVKFLRNADNAKVVSGFVRELADAIEYYQVRAPCPIATFNEHPVRFRCNKECMIRQGISTTSPRSFVMKPRTSMAKPESSMMIPRPSMVILRISW